jgi:NitT/TauT family transport system substrate-binding protein
MWKTIRRTSTVAAVGGLVALAAACSSSGSSGGSASSGSSTQTVTIGVTPAQITFAPVYYAQAAGYFKARGLNVKLVSLDNGTAELAALIGGDVNMIAGSAGTFANAADKGASLISVLGLAKMSEEVCTTKSWAAQHHITASSSVQARLAALKGATLGDTSAGSSSQTDFEYVLKAFGALDPQSDVTFTSTGSPGGAEAALSAGRIAAFMLSPPTCQSVANSFELVSPSQISTFRSMINNVLFTTQSFASSHAAELTSAVTAIARANNYVVANPDQAATAVKSSYPTGSVSLLTEALKIVASAVPANGAMTQSMWQATSTVLMGDGSITKPLDSSSGTLWTNKYIDTAYLTAHPAS